MEQAFVSRTGRCGRNTWVLIRNHSLLGKQPDSAVRSNKGRLLSKYKSPDGLNVKTKCILVIIRYTHTQVWCTVRSKTKPLYTTSRYLTFMLGFEHKGDLY